MKKLRAIVFWSHLVVAILAGLVIAIMSVTGVALAFRPQILARVERTPPPAASPLPLAALLDRVRAARPDAQASSLTLDVEGRVRVTVGRDEALQVDPATGEERPLPGAGWRRAFRVLLDWHRALGADGERRALGRAFTGACNAAFLFLALSGLYLWWPRRSTRRALRAAMWFRGGLHGKARDRNWHDVFGAWSAPVLLVITASGMMISYRWATALVYRVAGDVPPSTPAAEARVPAPPPPPGAAPLAIDGLVAAARQRVPAWRTLTVRLPADRAAGARQAIAILARERDAWPPFAARQLALDPHTGAVLRDETFADLAAGRRLRTWLRHLHTGEALGVAGQAVAAAGSLGGGVLVWTGLALAWRRLARRRGREAGPGA